MIIGIVGDTHNNLKNISRICEIFNEKEVDLVIHTGDITLPKSLKAFGDLNCKLLGVFGNNDVEEKNDLLKTSKKFKFNMHDEPFFLELNDKNTVIALREIAEGSLNVEELKNDLIQEYQTVSLNENENLLEKVDFIFHGHTHRYRNEVINETIIFNPGECAGFLKGKNQIGIVDTENPPPKVINF